MFNDKSIKQLRSKLRKNMPAPEVILWSRLKGKQLNGLKFRRQYSIGRYILDFYCPEKRLAIEIDGDSHFESKAIRYDQKRQELIESFSIRLIRFTNKEIIENIGGILNTILK
jgi:very-short-patch-repair endonuclease